MSIEHLKEELEALGHTDLSEVIAQTEYHKMNYQIQWTQPNFKAEAVKFFRDSKAAQQLEKKGLSFSDEDSLVDFLSDGNLRQFDRGRLIGHVENMDITDKTFKLALTDASYARLFYDMQKRMERYGKLRLDCPILIKFGSTFYLFSGNRECNIAFKFDLPIRFWIVDSNAAPQEVESASDELFYKHVNSDDCDCGICSLCCPESSVKEVRLITQEELIEKGKNFDFRKYLVNQEINIWKSIGKQVDQDDFDFICNRRGFTQEEQCKVYEGVKKAGLSNKLVPIKFGDSENRKTEDLTNYKPDTVNFC
jgi:hypothetical protein